MENENMIIAVLREHHLRLTKTRRALLELFLRTHTPLPAPKILRALAKVSVRVNKTTVYRELDRLVQVGLIHGIQLQDRVQYYELADRTHHHHLVCTLCHGITDVEINESTLLARAEQLSREIGFRITTHAVEFYGQCAGCLSAPLYQQKV